jgi:hypothetical protein
MPTSHRRAKLRSSERNLLEIKAGTTRWSRNERRIGYKPRPAHFQKQTAYGKDRQRYPLYLTVFWFRLVRISKKAVNRSSY